MKWLWCAATGVPRVSTTPPLLFWQQIWPLFGGNLLWQTHNQLALVRSFCFVRVLVSHVVAVVGTSACTLLLLWHPEHNTLFVYVSCDTRTEEKNLPAKLVLLSKCNNWFLKRKHNDRRGTYLSSFHFHFHLVVIKNTTITHEIPNNLNLKRRRLDHQLHPWEKVNRRERSTR